MASPFIAEFREGASGRLSGTLVDDENVPISLGYITAVTLTFSDQETGVIINSRDHQDVLNKNGVVITADGQLTWILTPDDNIILSPDINSLGTTERHVALFEWTYSTDRCGNCEIFVDVVNVPGV